VANKKKMREYRLHTLPISGGVSFITFLQFFAAMQTTDAKTDHRSKIVYRFAPHTQTEYQIGSDPVHCNTVLKQPIQVVTCLERPTSYIHVYECNSPTPKKRCAKESRQNTFKTVVETEIAEIWTYTSAVCTYVLTKSATAPTKGQASQAEPRFDISAYTSENHCIHDLFGRFAGGIAEHLHIVSRMYDCETHETDHRVANK
jgi:hypothetical protein